MENAELIEKNGTFSELIESLRHSPKAAAKETIDNISQESIKKTIDNTINEDSSINTIGPGLRALKAKGLLAEWEKKIGASDYLRLLEKQGTLFDLFYILQFSSQSMASDLAKLLSRDVTDNLVVKAVEEGRSIGSFRRELNLLRRLLGGFGDKFAQKVGIENILKLIFNNGNLGVLSDLIGKFTNSEISQLKLIETFNSLPVEKKDAFILRGDFYKLCSAVADCEQLDIFPGNKKVFSDRGAAVVKELLDKSTFKSINRGLGTLENFSDKGLKLSLFKLVNDSIDKIKIEAVNGESISERIAFLSILNRMDKLKKDVIVDIISNIDEEEFLQEKDFIGSLQLLQHILVVYDVDSWIREEILNLSNSDKVIKKLMRETPLNTFLYLWNTYALFIQEHDEDFSNWQNPEILDTIFRVVEKYKGTRANIEGTRHLLMLIGLLVYLEIEPERLLRIFPRGFRVLNLSKPFLEHVLGRSTFIPGFFYLMGIDLFTKKPLYPNKWKILIPRLFNLNLKTKAVRKLVEVFQRKIKRRIIPV